VDASVAERLTIPGAEAAAGATPAASAAGPGRTARGSPPVGRADAEERVGQAAGGRGDREAGAAADALIGAGRSRSTAASATLGEKADPAVTEIAVDGAPVDVAAALVVPASTWPSTSRPA